MKDNDIIDNWIKMLNENDDEEIKMIEILQERKLIISRVEQVQHTLKHLLLFIR